MNPRVLLVAAKDFPLLIKQPLAQKGFELVEARGRLRVVELLAQERFDAICWFYQGYEAALAEDLVEGFNQAPQIPLVLLTQTFEPFPFQERLSSLFGKREINDGMREIQTLIEEACAQGRYQPLEPKNQSTSEIDFKNAMGQLSAKAPAGEENAPEKKREPILKLETPWAAVDVRERQMLSQQKPEKKGFWSWFKK